MTRALLKSLQIKNLAVSFGTKKILQGVNLQLIPGQIAVLMGPNGSGKSTLAHVLMGRPGYQIIKGKITWQNKNILKLRPWQRARLGLFLAFQYPLEVPGVNLNDFLLTTYQALKGKQAKPLEFQKKISAALKNLHLSEDFLQRNLNENFSGGEKKKAELLQLMVLQPKIAILDELDSGLDIDALKVIAKNIKQLARQGVGFLVITHYQKLLKYLEPKYIHVIVAGKIIAAGSSSLIKKIDQHGFEFLTKISEPTYGHQTDRSQKKPSKI